MQYGQHTHPSGCYLLSDTGCRKELWDSSRGGKDTCNPRGAMTAYMWPEMERSAIYCMPYACPIM
eukprot:6645-Eustigmatos_ZCMA.PRE.1